MLSVHHVLYWACGVAIQCTHTRKAHANGSVGSPVPIPVHMRTSDNTVAKQKRRDYRWCV